jgi:hypothetical protein
MRNLTDATLELRSVLAEMPAEFEPPNPDLARMGPPSQRIDSLVQELTAVGFESFGFADHPDYGDTSILTNDARTIYAHVFQRNNQGTLEMISWIDNRAVVRTRIHDSEFRRYDQSVESMYEAHMQRLSELTDPFNTPQQFADMKELIKVEHSYVNRSARNNYRRGVLESAAVFTGLVIWLAIIMGTLEGWRRFDPQPAVVAIGILLSFAPVLLIAYLAWKRRRS